VDGGAFFNVEALPERSLLVFPLAIKPEVAEDWKPFGAATAEELYFGGLESVGFGRCSVSLAAPAAQEVR
jgi:CRISPR-associated protein Cmr4